MMTNRLEDSFMLREFLNDCDIEITKILHCLQWDRKTLNRSEIVSCRFDPSHRIPKNKKKEHEEECWLIHQGYSKDTTLLPELLNTKANTVVRLSSEDIKEVIINAAKHDPNFSQGNGWNGPAPLTLERLQATYTADERRAIYDIVVASDPTSHDLSDLALKNTNGVKAKNKEKSHVEILAELRDMKRRRTKYHVATKTKKYSDVLRDVIKTQMEMYSGVLAEQDGTKSLDLTSSCPEKINIKKERHSPGKKTVQERHYRSDDLEKRNPARDERKYNSSRRGDERRHRNYENRYNDKRSKEHDVKSDYRHHNQGLKRDRSRGTNLNKDHGGEATYSRNARSYIPGGSKNYEKYEYKSSKGPHRSIKREPEDFDRNATKRKRSKESLRDVRVKRERSYY